jgi:hypothetical protein
MNTYTLSFTNIEDAVCEVVIYDTASSGSANVDLEGAETPLVINVVDNDADKFTPIKAKEAVIQFISTETENVSLFSSGDDNRWYVEISVDGSFIFKGFLLMDDLWEPFLDPSIGNVVELVATDSLALLKDIALTKPDDTTPKGKFKIIEYIAWALSKTGLSLPINVCNGLTEYESGAVQMYEATYLDAKTFEAEIGSCEDCYTVLEKILGEECFLTQSGGEWWIMRLDEFDTNVARRAIFDEEGVYQSTSDVVLTQFIGYNTPMAFSEERTEVGKQRPLKFFRGTYMYEYPKEILDNIDWSRGDLIGVISIPGGAAYEVADWDNYKGGYNGFPETAPFDPAYIKRLFEDGYEKERYVVLPIVPAGNGNGTFLRSNAIYVSVKDKFTAAIDFSFSPGNPSNRVISVGPMGWRLFGDSGTVWDLLRDSGWVQSSASTMPRGIAYQYNTDNVDDTEWQTISKEAPPVPESGELRCYIIALGSTFFSGQEYRLRNLRFDYTPYINGSYSKYTGEYYKIINSSSGNKTGREKQISVSTSPRQLFKGALFKLEDSKYVLSEKFYDGREYPGSFDPDNAHPYGKQQAISVWNQYNRDFRLFNIQVQGLYSSPDLIHSYSITENSEHVNNKRFVLLYYSVDYKLCSWSGRLIEAYDSVIGKDISIFVDFKYMEDR